MKLIKKVSRETFVIVCLLFVFCTPSLKAKDNIGITANASILIDAENGSVYNGSNEDKVLGIASLTKLMTVYVAYDMIKEKKIDMKSTIKISQRAARIKNEEPAISGLVLTPGATISYEDAIKQTLILSDNGMAIVLAENLAGTEANFVELMNKKAKEMGLTKTIFYNVSGLTMYDYGSVMIPGTSKNDYNKSTATEIVTVAYNLHLDYPDIIKITENQNITVDGVNYKGYVYMADKDSDFYYTGVKGLKTGNSDEAKNSYIGYYESENNKKKFISVILGTETTAIKFNETAFMYNWADKQEYSNILDKTNEFTVTVDGASGGSSRILVPEKDIQGTYNKDVVGEVIKYEYNKDYFDENGVLQKSIPAGEVVCTAYLRSFDESKVYENISLYSGDSKDVGLPLVSRETISKGVTISDAFDATKEYFVGLYNDIF